MAPQTKKDRKAAREEYEAASSRESGRSLQRKLLQRRLNEVTDSALPAASHGEEAAQESHAPLPREDRAG